jgi:hypothetical protein
MLSPDHVEISRKMFDRILKLTGWTLFRHVTTDSANALLLKLEQAGATASYRNKFVMRLKAFARATAAERLAGSAAKAQARERAGREADQGPPRCQRRAARRSWPRFQELAGRRLLAYAMAAYNGSATERSSQAPLVGRHDDPRDHDVLCGSQDGPRRRARRHSGSSLRSVAAAAAAGGRRARSWALCRISKR